MHVHRFVKEVIALRSLRHHVRTGSSMPLEEMMRAAQVQLHGLRVGSPDLSWPSRSLAPSATHLSSNIHVYYALNTYWEPLDFELPQPPKAGLRWRRVINSALAAPDDISRPEDAVAVDGATGCSRRPSSR